MMTEAVELMSVTKRFGDVVAVNNVNLSIPEKEFFALLGPSGCGKTTTMRIIAGLEEPDEGTVRLHGEVVNKIPTHKRNVGMVFQHLALFPNMNVFDNVAFGLKMQKRKEGMKKRVLEMLAIVGLEKFEERRIYQLSGGQQQRVALARSLVTEPKVLLLDEPLGALDLKIRQYMMVELKNIQKKVGTTFVYVTHDQTEAITMADRVAVMKDGVIQQIGAPTEIYLNPRNVFIASFIGEAVNLLEGEYQPPSTFIGKNINPPIEIEYKPEKPVRRAALCIRPEKIRLGKRLENIDNVLDGEVESYIFKGSYTEYNINLNNQTRLKVFAPSVSGAGIEYNVKDKVQVGWDKGAAVPIPLE